MKNNNNLILIKFLILTLFSANSILAISTKDLDFIASHSLPQGPIKNKLDNIFAKTSNITKALEAAKFKFLKKDNQIVAEHPDLAGFLIKALPEKTFKITILSNNLNLRRVEIADRITKTIKKHNLSKVMVPKKYLYHIPNTKNDLNDRNYIVVVEKLDLIDAQENQKAMKNLTYQQREEILLVIEKVGLFDTRSNNIVFTKQGVIAFVDTEPRWDFNKIPFLSKIFRNYLGRKGAQRFYHDITRGFEENNNSEEPILDTFTYEIAGKCEKNEDYAIWKLLDRALQLN